MSLGDRTVAESAAGWTPSGWVEAVDAQRGRYSIGRGSDLAVTAIPERLRLGSRIEAVDAHACGEPGRVIVGGVEDVPGRTMFDKMMWLRANRDDLRLRMHGRRHLVVSAGSSGG